MMAWGLLGAGVWFGRETGEVENVDQVGPLLEQLLEQVRKAGPASRRGNRRKPSVFFWNSHQKQNFHSVKLRRELCGLFAARSPSKAARDPRAFPAFKSLSILMLMPFKVGLAKRLIRRSRSGHSSSAGLTPLTAVPRL
jgi:hypothetical protein